MGEISALTNINKHYLIVTFIIFIWINIQVCMHIINLEMYFNFIFKKLLFFFFTSSCQIPSATVVSSDVSPNQYLSCTVCIPPIAQSYNNTSVLSLCLPSSIVVYLQLLSWQSIYMFPKSPLSWSDLMKGERLSVLTNRQVLSGFTSRRPQCILFIIAHRCSVTEGHYLY